MNYVKCIFMKEEQPDLFLPLSTLRALSAFRVKGSRFLWSNGRWFLGVQDSPQLINVTCVLVCVLTVINLIKTVTEKYVECNMNITET